MKGGGYLKFKYPFIPQVYLKTVNFFACMALIQLGCFEEGSILNFGELVVLTWR